MKPLIGIETKKSIKEMLAELIDSHHAELNEAMSESEDDRVAISMSISIERLSEDICNIECGIAFNLKKVKDKVKKRVNEKQIGLFSKDTTAKIEKVK